MPASGKVHCQKPGCRKSWPQDPALKVACPTCGARKGQRCKRPSGHRVFGGMPHGDRDLEADAKGCYGACPLKICGMRHNKAAKRRQDAYQKSKG